MEKVRPGAKEYADYVEAMRIDHPALAGEISWFQGIHNVLDWMNQRSFSVIDMIGQDEFEYDFMVQTEPNQSWLVFGVT